ncbi:MAG TPA: DNA translocase FtsK 4TM domain-containing protein, partial [Terriglobales bacterium]|nr:DNA translocase FtsK 4TM domain-containing protein [Terriglobales bacterium]
MVDHAQSVPMSGGFRGFMQRRMTEALGGGLVLLGLALLLAFLSASAGDPSFNRAVDQPTRNLMGPLGAYVADFALQGLGLGVFALFAAPIAWGWRLVRQHGLTMWWLRLTLVPVAAILLAMAAAGLPDEDAAPATTAAGTATGTTVTAPAWPWKAGMGGFAGHLLIEGTAGLNSGLGSAPDATAAPSAAQPQNTTGGFSGLLATFGVPALFGSASLLPAAISGVLALIALYFALGIGLHSYLHFGRNVASAGRKVGLVIERRGRGLIATTPDSRGTSHRDDDEDETESAPWHRKLFAFGGRLIGGSGEGARREPHFEEDDTPQQSGRSYDTRVRARADDEEPAFEQPSLQQPSPRTRNLVAQPVVREKPAKTKRATVQPSLALEESSFELPPHDLLARPSANAAVQKINEESLEKNARLLETVLEDFGVKGEIVKVRPGPVVTLYELEPAPGTKTSRVVSLADDVARSMSAVSVRIAVVPGRSVIGIELPNRQRESVALRELLEEDSYQSTQSKLALALGKDIGGAPIVVDLARMPHLLIAGTTGSGKSVAINTMILSLLYRLTPDQCKFIMIDPKMLELSVYDGIPHLLSPVVTEPRKAVVALKWTVREMENRYRSMSKLGVRNIEGYNQRLEQARQAGEELTR